MTCCLNRVMRYVVVIGWAVNSHSERKTMRREDWKGDGRRTVSDPLTFYVIFYGVEMTEFCALPINKLYIRWKKGKTLPSWDQPNIPPGLGGPSHMCQHGMVCWQRLLVGIRQGVGLLNVQRCWGCSWMHWIEFAVLTGGHTSLHSISTVTCVHRAKLYCPPYLVGKV